MAHDDNSGGSFLREVKRRKVVRTSVYYILACWAVLQVLDIVLPAMGLDGDRYAGYFLYGAIIGFPISFALAWYFQLTSEGIVKTDAFVERRVLNNIAPINDKRHAGVGNYFQKESSYNWIISAETGTLSGLSFGVNDTVVLGRSLDCELAIVSPHVSRRHAQLTIGEGDQLFVEDLGSSNGTVVNGKLVQGKTPLRHEDELRFHDVVFRITESYAGRRSETESMNQTTFIERGETDSDPA